MFAYCTNDPVNNEDPDGEYGIPIRRHNTLGTGIALLTIGGVSSGLYAKNRIKSSYTSYKFKIKVYSSELKTKE